MSVDTLPLPIISGVYRRACMLLARRPAPLFTEPTGWGPTRCWIWSSLAAHAPRLVEI